MSVGATTDRLLATAPTKQIKNPKNRKKNDRLVSGFAYVTPS
jgi:hypothetical protein